MPFTVVTVHNKIILYNLSGTDSKSIISLTFVASSNPLWQQMQMARKLCKETRKNLDKKVGESQKVLNTNESRIYSTFHPPVPSPVPHLFFDSPAYTFFISSCPTLSLRLKHSKHQIIYWIETKSLTHWWSSLNFASRLLDDVLNFRTLSGSG